jgi:nucleoside-diphosphate-sugar epimerase
MKMSKILVTGETGFIGKALCRNLKFNKYLLQITTRTNHSKKKNDVISFNIGEINSATNWTDALVETDCVIHCAAKTHAMKEVEKNSSATYRKVNFDGTINLAEQAAAHGVRRLIFISSVKVNGEYTVGLSKFKYNDIPKPDNLYSISKWKAEQGLWDVSRRTGLEIVIIRAPLVYGARVKGNFLRLLDLVYKQIPLPIAKINNLRSFIALDNLIDLIICCINHPKATGKTFLVSDGEDLSTPELIRKLSKFMHKSPRLFEVPETIIRLIGSLIGKSLQVKKLYSSLRVDNLYAREILGWKPTLTVDKALEKTVRWYLKNR